MRPSGRTHARRRACIRAAARTLLMASLRARGRFAFQSAAWRAAKLHVHHLTTVRPNPATLAYFSSRASASFSRSRLAT